MNNSILEFIVNNTRSTIPSYFSPDEVTDLITQGLIVGNPDQPQFDAEGNATGRLPFWATEAGVDALIPPAPITMIPAPQPVATPEPAVALLPAPVAVTPAAVAEVPQVVAGKGQLVAGIAKKERSPRTSNLSLEQLSVGEFKFVKDVKPKSKSAVVSKANKYFRDQGIVAANEFAIETYYAEANQEVFAGITMPVAGTYIYRVK